MVKNRKKEILIDILILIAAVIIFYPILMMVQISFKSTQDYLLNPFGFSLNFEPQNYVTAFKQMNYLNALKNSVILTVCSAIGCSLLCSIASYAIARGRIKAKVFVVIGAFFWLGLTLPHQVVMVPLVLWMKTLHINGTIFGVILVFIATNASYGVFFFTGFVSTVPVTLEEAARIDGASHMAVLSKIVLPLLRTPMVTLLIIMVLRVYNNFMMPLILLQGRNSRTLPLTIYFFKGDFEVSWNVMFAATTLVVLPLMIFYFVFQRKIIDGMMSGSIKM